MDKQFNTKDTETMHQDKEKEKEKERQPAKEKDTQQAATDVVSQATWQKTVELQPATFRRTSRKDTTMQQSSCMDHKPPMTTIGGQITTHTHTSQRSAATTTICTASTFTIRCNTSITDCSGHSTKQQQRQQHSKSTSMSAITNLTQQG